MKKSVFTLLALTVATASVFTSCDKNDYVTEKHFFSDSNSYSNNNNSGSSTSENKTQENNDTVKVTMMSSASSLELTSGAPSNAAEQVAAAVKNYLSSNLSSDWGKIESTVENGNVVVTLNTTNKYKLPAMTMISTANNSKFSNVLYNLGYVKNFSMTLANTKFSYQLGNEYKGTWECTDVCGNKYVLKVAESTASPVFSETYNATMTVNGVEVKTAVSRTSISALADNKSSDWTEKLANAIQNSFVMSIKSYSGNKMVVKIEALSGVVDKGAVFTKVQD